MSELKLAFGTVVCIEGGVVGDHEFKEGEIYPVLGYNNGVQIGFTTNEKYCGDMECLMCHNYGHLAPISDEQGFGRQNGTMPPLFDEIILKWRAVCDAEDQIKNTAR